MLPINIGQWTEMATVNLFVSPPCWYWIIAIPVSAYQAWRRYVFQRQFAERQAQQDPAGTPGVETRLQLFLMRSLADGQFYFLTILAGFGSLLLAYRILRSTASRENMSAGAGTILVFLSLFGILGITGKLPDLLQQGKFPR
jgi:hypothetical protein